MAKGRKARTVANKREKLRKFYNNCPKLQKRMTLQDWLKQIKETNNK